jgi:hypothetical protein
MAPAAVSDLREGSVALETFNQQLGGMPSPLESAPAGPNFAVAPGGQGVQGGPDSFAKEANKESEAASQSGEGLGGFGGGLNSRGGGLPGGGGLGGAGGLESSQPFGAAGAARGSMRTKQPAPADAIAEKTSTDKVAGEKAEAPPTEKPAPQQPAGEGARTADAGANRGGKNRSEENRGGQADGPSTRSRSAGTMKAAASAPGSGGRPATDAALPADGFTPAPTPAPAIAVQEQQRSEGEENQAPVTLYFNPRLETDADGYATIELQMPNTEADYRILIDAIGHGRIGSAEMLIMCRK